MGKGEIQTILPCLFDKFQIPIHDKIELDYVAGIDNFTTVKTQCLLPAIIWFIHFRFRILKFSFIIDVEIQIVEFL